MRLAALVMAVLSSGALAEDFARLPGQPAFTSILKNAESDGTVPVAPFELMTRPVTNAQFLAFVLKHPEWRRGAAAPIFAEPRYLEHWRSAVSLGDGAEPEQPVTRVSWFAARAYCEAINARLPTWTEWEYAAAADATRADARQDPAWRERMLRWYAKPSSAPIARVGQGVPDVHGIHDLHGLVWEWVDDYAAMLVAADNRNQADPDLLKFCGAGALETNDRENYAVLMRIAMLSALEGNNTTGNLGFRCARDATGDLP